MTKPESNDLLSSVVVDYEKMGCKRKELGLCNVRMPKGYALMINADRSHYFWLREDGVESVIHWNRFAIYKWAKLEALKAG
jgi:hypothetical protein